MFYEECIINNILMYRTSPAGSWYPKMDAKAYVIGYFLDLPISDQQSVLKLLASSITK